jgi:hypothetical protein
MSVSKRTRYEVLRRDNHTCRYCGGTAPDVTLTVDHVTPVSLGGSDDPSNLVAACKDCNAGKSSTSPDAALVEDVKAIDLAWAGAIRRASRSLAAQRKKENAYLSAFEDEWAGYWNLDLGGADPDSVARLYRAGLPKAELVDCVRIAATAWKARDRFAYFMGVANNRLTLLQETAKQLLEADRGGE